MFRPGFWRSPLRGAWLTALLGMALLPMVLVVIVTGFLSHAAYLPDLGRNQLVDTARDFQPFVFDWPTHPAWLYATTQGLHVTIGIVAVPLLLAKLWSVIPRLFAWPPVASPAQALERVSILLLVGSAFFPFATGIANVQLWYPFHFSFVWAHYFGAWIFTAALVLHVGVKIPVIREARRTRTALAPELDAERIPVGGTIGRRALFGLVGGAAAALAVTTAGQSIGGPLRRFAVLAPRGPRAFDDGPNGFASTRRRRASATLPIACVEGWSTTQRWSGVRLADLARLAGQPDASTVLVQSLQQAGKFSRSR
jgi:DMSO/TMAO reductase YedYZ molybdopterin-dependent catalytic subunit